MFATIPLFFYHNVPRHRAKLFAFSLSNDPLSSARNKTNGPATRRICIAPVHAYVSTFKVSESRVYMYPRSFEVPHNCLFETLSLEMGIKKKVARKIVSIARKNEWSSDTHG